MRAPDFWDKRDFLSRSIAAALSPIGSLYAAGVRLKEKQASPLRVRVPVICVGNITAGGTGKTPIAIAIADAVIARGKNPFFLSRGYGGTLKGPLVITPGHKAQEVGDEPLLLSKKAATVVSRDRARGAELAVERGADVIIMDDGHQNFSLAKDLSLVVVDAAKGFGNEGVLPAGPLREPVIQGLGRADAIILSGQGSPHLHGFNGPILRARIATQPGLDFKGQRFVAFAGIGRPDKFFATLSERGAEVEGIPFPDHHFYTNEEIKALKTKARAAKANLITTEKDFVRLTDSMRDDVEMLPVTATIEPLALLDELLDRIGLPL